MAPFAKGDRVKRAAADNRGTVLSIDGPPEDYANIMAPNVTYTVEWDEGGHPESYLTEKDLVLVLRANITPADIAGWMMEQLQTKRELYQEDAVYEIAKKFGSGFTYENDNGNLAIDKKVLDAFRELSEDGVVWERGERLWRRRDKHDETGRSQG
jgi:hypothetical protein